MCPVIYTQNQMFIISYICNESNTPLVYLFEFSVNIISHQNNVLNFIFNKHICTHTHAYVCVCVCVCVCMCVCVCECMCVCVCVF